MLSVLSVENMRASDAFTIKGGVPGIELMARAGEGIYNTLVDKYDINANKDTNVAIVCGTGNNAGDGYVLALLLNKNDIPVKLFILKNKFSDDGYYYYEKCVKESISISFIDDSEESGASLYGRLKEYAIIIDCLLGTGFKGVPRDDIKNAINAINEAKNVDSVTVVSVDINSGLNADNGMYDTCVISDLTICIGGLKSGLYLNYAKDCIGELVNIDIGIEPIHETYYLFESKDAKKSLPIRAHFSNKGTYGYIGLIGGSKYYQGAIMMAAMANASMRSGAGVVMLATPSGIASNVRERILESTVFPLKDNDGEVVFDKENIDILINRSKTIAYGMGIGTGQGSFDTLEYILKAFNGILIIDADGLNVLSKMDREVLTNSLCKRIVLTPHIKEFSRLTGKEVSDIFNEPIKEAEEYSLSTNTIVLLKGPTSIVTDGKRTILVDRGCPGMATAGSGDVLSGIASALCAYNEDTLNAVATAAFINGMSGELAQEKYGDISMVAGDTIESIPEAIKLIRQ